MTQCCWNFIKQVINAIDPETGQRAEYEIESSNWKPGWNDIEIIVGGKSQSINVFRKPTKNQAVKTIDEVCFEFEVIDAAASPLVLQCNGVEIARLECPEVGICRFPIPLGGLCDWNIIKITGDGNNVNNWNAYNEITPVLSLDKKNKNRYELIGAGKPVK